MLDACGTRAIHEDLTTIFPHLCALNEIARIDTPIYGHRIRVKACKTVEELVALVKAEGVELSDKQLESIAGGDSF